MRRCAPYWKAPPVWEPPAPTPCPMTCLPLLSSEAEQSHKVTQVGGGAFLSHPWPMESESACGPVWLFSAPSGTGILAQRSD
ncbi:uncharacterized protein UV8b_01851 [Ustilaginoidea virens]|uniref:Uncharacterized protein n=1 Tax=Ustilaginoidea virens TaxID=1159556 RepID=A0A8E5HLT1_USTVR|nr:uncharacterized protein UV8b_01851 [Ustilaginoidea virens]QUC17610.1 hypothetical protein UV8b_01851 [Ustilaginoidea virens]